MSNKQINLLNFLFGVADEDDKSSKSAKKRRVETFQQKEKRKRDMGQATSDKTFVEEEKRILRQSLQWGLRAGLGARDRSSPKQGCRQSMKDSIEEHHQSWNATTAAGDHTSSVSFS